MAEEYLPVNFDKPLRTIGVTLPAQEAYGDARRDLTCFYYAGFMVKQIDSHEKGAEQLAIAQLASNREPPCEENPTEGEKIINWRNWSGWFKGAKGDYLFFEDDDGRNGGLGFAIFNPAGKKIFEDSTGGDDIGTAIYVDQLDQRKIVLYYRRVYLAPCSLFADEKACWEQIAQQTGLSEPIPDCKTAYEEEQRTTPGYAKAIKTLRSIIDYNVEVVIEPSNSKMSPLSAGKSCWLED